MILIYSCKFRLISKHRSHQTPVHIKIHVPPELIFNTVNKSVFMTKRMLIKGKLCYHVNKGLAALNYEILYENKTF